MISLGRVGEVETLENTFLQQAPKWNNFEAIFCLKFAEKDYRGEKVMTNCPFGQRSLRMTLQLCVCDTTSQNSPLRWAKITHKSPSRALQKTLFFMCALQKKQPRFYLKSRYIKLFILKRNFFEPEKHRFYTDFVQILP